MTQLTPSSRSHTRSRTLLPSALYFEMTMISRQTPHGCAAWAAGAVAVEAEEEEEDVAAQTGTINTTSTTVIACMA